MKKNILFLGLLLLVLTSLACSNRSISAPVSPSLQEDGSPANQ